jgi:signal transduction histidine kinase
MFRGISKTIALGLAAAVGVLVVSALLTYRNIQAIAEKEARVVHTHEVLDELRLLFSLTRDAESGQRGYIITGEDSYLAPYHNALQAIDATFERISKLLEDNQEQQERLASLKNLVDVRVHTLSEGVAAHERDGFEGGQAHVQRGLGQSQAMEIRDAITKLMVEEQRLLDDRTTASRTIYGTAHATNIATTVVGLVLVGAVFAYALRELGERARREQELEQRVQERTVALNEANAALKISNRELEQFASVASHDLQEPLRKIEAFGDRLKSRSEESLDEQGQDYLERMLTSASRMRRLINDLLTFSRVATKGQPAESVSLKSIASEVASDLEGRVEQGGGRIEIGELPTIEADPLQVRQLLQNLIGNGLKFQRPGVPPIVQVEAQILQNGGGPAICELTVADNGIGFDEIYLDRIFNVFQRLHGRNEYEGTGMGLAICRKIAERHGGSITAKSEPNAGAKFIVSLPVTAPKKEVPT